MGSQTDDGDNGGENLSNKWEAHISESSQATGQSCMDRDEESIQDIADDENALSPASKKLLEKCAVSMPPPSNKPQAKAGVSVIARPLNTELDIAGFNFAKPAHPKTNFSCRSRAIASSDAPKTTSNGTNKNVTKQKLHGNAHEGSDLASDRLDFQNEAQDSSQSIRTAAQPPENVPYRPTSTTPSPDSSQRTGISTHTDPITAKPPIPPTPEKLNPMDHQLHARSEEYRDVTISRRGIDHSPKGGARERPKASRLKETTLQKTNENHTPLEPRPSSSTQPSKVVKRQGKPKGKPTHSTRENGSSILGSPAQPSEEDLFYILIHRLRQREDSEAASAALKEHMEVQIREMTRVNEDLQAQLEQAHHHSLNQEAEIGSNRGLIDRWKAKFAKLRAFLVGIGNDYECLRKEGQAIKSTQTTLGEERQAINESLNRLYENTDRMEQQWNKHQKQFTDVRHDVGSIQQSLSIAQAKVTDGKRLLSQEKRRVSVFENFIRDHSIKQQNQTTQMQQRQVETKDKLDLFFDYVQKRWDDSQSALKSEVQPGLDECLKLVRLLCDQDCIKPIDLQTVHDTIHALSNRLDFHITQSSGDAERSLKLQADHSSDFRAQFEKFEDILNFSASTTEHLIRARELNGRLEEKLKTVEETLERTTTERNKYMSVEKHLQKRISDLEVELTSARQQPVNPPIDSTQYKEEQDRVSQLQTQLEEAATIIAEEREKSKSKENEICELHHSLGETKASLEDSKHRMAQAEMENAELQEQTRRVEYRVREELSRASLTSRDQNRAWFEQQVHKLKQEKLTAENSAARAQEQLAIAKESLDRAERSKPASEEQEAKITTLSRRVKELEEMRLSSLEMEAEIENLKGLHVSHREDRMVLEQQFETTKLENERFGGQIHELQKAALKSSNTLQERISLLEDQISQKDNDISDLKGKLEVTSSKAEEATALEHSIDEKIQEIAILKNLVEDANKKCMEADDSATLRRELASMDQNKADLADLQTKIDRKEQELSALQGRIQETDRWSRRAEDFLHKIQVLDKKESVFENWDLLETRLSNVFGNQPYEAGINSNHQVVPFIDTPKRPKHKPAKSSRTSTPSKLTGNGNKDCEEVFRESHTHEVVYLSHSRQNSVHASPLKQPTSNQGTTSSREHRPSPSKFIKPFSQVQSDVITQEPSSSSDVCLSDLSGMFPSTLCKDNPCPGAQTNHPKFPEDTRLLRSRRDSVGDVGQRKAGNTSKIRKDSNDAKLGKADALNNRRKRDTNKKGKGLIPPKLSPPDLKRKASNHSLSDDTENGISRAPTLSHQVSLHGAESASGPKPRNPEYTKLDKPLVNSGPFTPNQKSSRNILPKGILKDTASAAMDYQPERPGIADTTLDGKGRKTKALRGASSRQLSGTTSEYFGRASSPKSSMSGGGIFGVNQPSTQSVTYVSREKRRRSSRGHRYNDRFSQGVTWAE